MGTRGRRGSWRPSSTGTGYYVKVEGPSQSNMDYSSQSPRREEAYSLPSPQSSINTEIYGHDALDRSHNAPGTSVSHYGDRHGDSFHAHGFGAAKAQIRATFYPKFENEKSDQEIRMKMIDIVQSGRGVLEVSLKHSGSLFMYSGHYGAFAKNSFGNLYTAVGVFVLDKLFEEAWGVEAAARKRDFNAYLERHHLCVSMELVTAVLGDHGQRPKHDYVVVTAVANLQRKPQFYSTPEIIVFCRQWRLPSNHVWLFSSRKSATSFFTAYDALCEEGTATAVSKVLNEISDVSVQATKSHTQVQGEILEGLVARIVSPQSTEKMLKALQEFPLPTFKEQIQPGKSLRELCAENRGSEQQKIDALLQGVGYDMCSDLSDWSATRGDNSLLNKFLKAKPASHMTLKLQEMIHLLRGKNMGVRYPCHLKANYDKSLCFRLTIHVTNDSVFRRYQVQMRTNPQLWPLYRGFFVDIELFASDKGDLHTAIVPDTFQANLSLHGEELADETEHLMLKLKFLPYKIRTFLIRNGLSTLFRSGFQQYRDYYLKQLRNWNTSREKQRHLDELLSEWAHYITTKHKGKGLHEQTYLSEAEPFLEAYAKRNALNQRLVGFAGGVISTEDFLSTFRNEDEPVFDGDSPMNVDNSDKGMLVFFPGIPGCGKSAVCQELLRNPGDLADGRTLHTLMGDLVKGRYWPQLLGERQKGSPLRITLADKNAPNVEVWQTIQSMCESTHAIGVPVVPDSEGTDSNPFALDILCLFIYRVLQRVNHPGNLDKNSPNAGYVLLMFYNLYEGKDRSEFEADLKQRFGCLVRLPLLKENRPDIPQPVLEVITHGLDLFRRHTAKHGRLDSTKGSFRQEWSNWEDRLREVVNGHSAYFDSIQVPFDETVKSLREQLLAIVKGEIPVQKATESERSFKNVTYAALVLSSKEILDVLNKLALADKDFEGYMVGRGIEGVLQKRPPHVTLAHKASHGVAAVAAFGEFRGEKVLIELTALLFSSQMCALEVHFLANNKGILSKNEWPHITVWTEAGVKAKEASHLPQLVEQGKASYLKFIRPIVVTGVVDLL